VSPFIPRSLGIDLAHISFARRIVEVLIDDGLRWGDLADRKARLEAFERCRERFHMRDLPRHEEPQRVLGADIVTESDETLIDNLGAGLRRDIASEINVEFACDFEVIGGPRVAHGVEQVDSAPAGDGNEGIGFGGFALGTSWAPGAAAPACQQPPDGSALRCRYP
jgi:hypothetical protein